MGEVYRRKIEFHPGDGVQAIRANYAVLLREVADSLENDDTISLPITILAKLNGPGASDLAEIVFVCFGNRLELRHIERFIDADHV